MFILYVYVMKKLYTFLCVAVLLGNTNLVAQGLINGFMQGAGKSRVTVVQHTESFDRFFIGQQETYYPTYGEISQFGVTLTAATGLTSWADVIVGLPYLSTSSNAGFWSTQSSFQDFSAALRLRPFSVKLETGTLDVMVAGHYSTPITKYQNDSPVMLGAGATAFDGRIMGTYLSTSGIFINAQWGYCARGRAMINRGYEVDAPDAVDIVAKAGYRDQDWHAEAWANTMIAQSGATMGPGVPFPSLAMSSTRVGGLLSYKVGYGLSIIGSGFITVKGANVGHSSRTGIGISYQLPEWSGIDF